MELSTVSVVPFLDVYKRQLLFREREMLTDEEISSLGRMMDESGHIIEDEFEQILSDEEQKKS